MKDTEFLQTLLKEVQNDTTLNDDYKKFIISIFNNLNDFYEIRTNEHKISDSIARYFYKDSSPIRIIALILDLTLDMSGTRHMIAKLSFKNELTALLRSDKDEDETANKH